MGGDQQEDSARFERVLMSALQAGEIADAVFAKSRTERDEMWSLRDDVSQLQRNSPIFTFDIGIRISEMESYVAEIRQALAAKWPQMTLVVFGHLGDGNLHVVAGVADGSREARHAVEEIIYTPLRKRGGTVSAEHGIGFEKRSYLGWSRSPEEVALMRTLKRTLDPLGILNPGKIFADPASP
jgi:FAD/FMN-containing dehydrogenase